MTEREQKGAALDSDIGVLELGCGTNPDDRADTTLDTQEFDHVDVVWDLEEAPWPFPDESTDGIIMTSVLEHLPDTVAAFSEMSRILKPGGWIELRVPFGAQWYRDPTHEQYWIYSTPRYFADDESHEWNFYFDFPLDLTDRSFSSLWFIAPGLSKLSPLLRFVGRKFPGDWVCTAPWVSGSMMVRYRKTE